MKKTLLSLCVMLAAFVGMASAQNVLDNNLTGNKRFTVTVSTNEGGSIEISGTGQTSKNSTATATIPTGEDVLLIITPEEGFQLATLTVDGVDKKADVADNAYTIKAISKNTSVTATFEAIPSPTLKGDVNKDGQVNSADVTAVYAIISGEPGDSTLADIDGDGNVSSGDVAALYNIISGSAE